MQITRLALENWRNYKYAEIEFSETQNLLFGKNAQGKTNLLEAIFYLSCLKTFRSKADFDAVLEGEKKARLRAGFIAYGRELEVSCDITKGKRNLSVNGIPVSKPSEHIGLIKTVVFSPDDLQLIKEGPALRRRFMNIAISQMRPSYIRALSEHNKLIESKRKILKMEEGKEKYFDYLDVINEKLARAMNEITRERAKFLDEISKSATETMKRISGGNEALDITYNCDSAAVDPAADNFENYLLHLSRRKEAELASEMCLVGAHRDDFTVRLNGKIARDFASQGQIRSCVLALKCAEHEIIERDSGEKPILLLDDVLSELDPSRRAFLINDVNRGQTVITGCDPSMFSELQCGKIFTISKGEVKGETEGRGM